MPTNNVDHYKITYKFKHVIINEANIVCLFAYWIALLFRPQPKKINADSVKFDIQTQFVSVFEPATPWNAHFATELPINKFDNKKIKVYKSSFLSYRWFERSTFYISLLDTVCLNKGCRLR